MFTFRDYAISNDEGVQHHYGELIIAYYRSGFADLDLFTYQNLYLYGGLFDVIAVGLAKVIPIDPYTLRHILCAMTGIGGIAAAAATARLVAGARAGLIAALALSLCGAWYGAMFNHTKDIPFAAAMMAATFFLVRLARDLPFAAQARCHCVRLAHRCGAWRAQPRAAVVRLSRARHCHPSAVAAARGSPALCRVWLC